MNRLRQFIRRLRGFIARDLRGWNEDWQVGDLAKCHARGFYPPTIDDPTYGQILRVSALVEGVSMHGTIRISALKFEGKPQRFGWHCAAFTKVRPEATAEEVETGIIARIKRAARHGAGVDA
jgi:hypothetical protein